MHNSFRIRTHCWCVWTNHLYTDNKLTVFMPFVWERNMKLIWDAEKMSFILTYRYIRLRFGSASCELWLFVWIESSVMCLMCVCDKREHRVCILCTFCAIWVVFVSANQFFVVVAFVAFGKSVFSHKLNWIGQWITLGLATHISLCVECMMHTGHSLLVRLWTI